jgi:signal transduction histidine kinase
MLRRLLGPTGGPVMFFLVAALVFAGLGWVTVVALRVERAQREAAAQAELGNNLRVALWRLDGRMLPALGVEDSRPFYHYNSADPLSGSTAGPTPLLAAPLPEWMKLHIQLHRSEGWTSPQYLTPEGKDRVAEAWPELPLRNYTPDRIAILNEVKDKFPAPATWDWLAARDHAFADNSLPFAAPLFTNDLLQQHSQSPSSVPPSSLPKPPPPPGLGPVSSLPPVAPAGDRTSDAFRFLGFQWVSPEAIAGNLRDTKKEKESQQPGKPTAPNAPAIPGIAQAPGSGSGGGRGNFNNTLDNERGRNDYVNRAQIIQRATLEAKNAGLEYPQFSKGNFGQYLNEQKGNPTPGIGNNDNNKNDGKAAQQDLDKLKNDLHKQQDKAAKAKDAMNQLQAEQLRGTLTEHLATLSLGMDRRRCLDEVRDETRKQVECLCDESQTLLVAAWNIVFAAREYSGAPRPVPPAEERPAANNFLGNSIQNTLIAAPGVNIHLGSMRPQWITANDGTETLLLVRAAKIDNNTVYQGVVLDWSKLEQLLREEVQDIFPEAKLVPVKDPAGVSPDRAMTALPVQLDPGAAAELPPAGWTPLRIGLAMAWVAAFIAIVAVGLSGWSLIDLAERRIRFVSAVTHELRTPLTSLRLYLDLLTSGMIHDEAKRQEYLSTLAVESDRLHRLVDNVLDFAKLEKRRKNGDLKPIQIGELISQLQQTWAERVAADGKELVVVTTLPPEMEVCTDSAMVHQIVGNLIDNARKYTRDAEDKRIWLWAKPDGAHRVVFEVEDRGSGVPASERKSIFKPFRRGEQADAKAGGAGLGLALAKQWAEVLGGTVSYRPADGAPGSCFRLELPTK